MLGHVELEPCIGRILHGDFKGCIDRNFSCKTMVRTRASEVASTSAHASDHAEHQCWRFRTSILIER